MKRVQPTGPSAAGPHLDAAAAHRGSTVEEMSECSFPASDPPAVWTWEVSDTASPLPPRAGLSDKPAR